MFLLAATVLVYNNNVTTVIVYTTAHWLQTLQLFNLSICMFALLWNSIVHFSILCKSTQVVENIYNVDRPLCDRN